MTFVFDPEIDDLDLDIFFEFVVAGTWEAALAVLDNQRERSGSQVFWETVRDAVQRCDDPELRHHLLGQAQIGLRHVADNLTPTEREALHRQPKPRPQGDLEAAHRLDARRREGADEIDPAAEREIVRSILAIDPCATTVWISHARFQPGGESHPAFGRAMKRFGLCLSGEYDLAMFAFSHGVQSAAKSLLGRCLRTLTDLEGSFPHLRINLLSALGVLHAQLDENDAALDCLEQANVLVDGLAASIDVGHDGKRLTGEEIFRCRVNLAFARMRSGRLDAAEDLFADLVTMRDAPPDEVDYVCARLLIGLGDVARRRGDDERAMVQLVQGIELCGLRVTRDGRLTDRVGTPWRPAAGVPFLELSSRDYPAPAPDQIDPGGTWFCDSYQSLVSLIDAEHSPEGETDAHLDQCLLRVAMTPRSSTQRGAALSSLGTGYWRRGMLAEAEAALRAARSEYSATEAGWSACADAEQILASVLFATERYDDALDTIGLAISLFPQSLDISRELIGQSLAQCHFLRARILAKQGVDRTEIVAEARTAAEFLKAQLSLPKEQRADDAAENLGLMLVALGHPDEGADLLLDSSASRICGQVAYVDVTTSPLGSLHRTGRCAGLWLVLQLIVEKKIDQAPYLAKIMGMLLEARQASILAFRRIVQNPAAGHAVTQQLRRDLHLTRERIYANVLADDDPLEDVDAMTHLEREIMSRLHAEIDADRGAPAIDNDLLLRLRDSLTEDEAHVEFVFYEPINLTFDTDFHVSAQPLKAAAIACWKSSGSLLLQFFALGDEDNLGALAGFLNRPYLFRASEPSHIDREIAGTLGWRLPFEDNIVDLGMVRGMFRERYNETLGPLIHRLSKFRRWRVGIRGSLAHMSFDFLPLAGSFAIKRHEIIRDALFDPGGNGFATGVSTGGAPVVLGAPEFEYISPLEGEAQSSLRRHFLTGPFDGLPGAKHEASAIAQLLGVSPLLGRDATRESFLAVDNPSILHVATHGIFLKAEHREEAANALRGSNLRKSEAGRHALARLIRDDPNSHIALAFASGQRGTAEGQFLHEGLVFGDEIAVMNLVDTDLVTLSCCDSGVGLIHMIHGSINFPRAFLCAGAKAVVAALWPLADAYVQPLMTSFYRYIIAGVPVATALAQAKRDAEAAGVPRLVWGGLQLYGRGDHVVRKSIGST